MSSAERFPLMLFFLLGGLFIVFMPYIFSGLYIMLTNEAAKKNSKIPLDSRERIKWIVKSTLRGGWVYFAIVIVLLFYDGCVLLLSFFQKGD